MPVFERLAQYLKGPPTELGKLVEKEHTQVRERDLTGPRIAPPAGEPGGRDGVVRRPERPAAEQRSVDLAPALCTLVTSMRSPWLRGGSIPVILRASIVLPEPGGPLISTL